MAFVAKISVTVATTLIFLTITNAALEGPNVCTRETEYQVTVKVSEQKPYMGREHTWCLRFLPRCSKYKVIYKTVYSTQLLTKHKRIEECCKGYTLTADGERCIPVCSEDCRHGRCTAPDVCTCESGFDGQLCDLRCPFGKWGKNCRSSCKCQNGASCDPFDGKCICTRGWKGALCDERCSPDRFGKDCGEVCRCQNGGSCYHISGECHCAAGYTGPLCTEPCPAGTHGDECKSECRCQNGGSCNPRTGECVCTSGWMGSVCANSCPDGFWGNNCSLACDCYNGATCHHITGDCLCMPGFKGEKCFNRCPEGKFGQNCIGRCSCLNGATCHSVDGKCECSPGWMGRYCRDRACPDGFYGANCKKPCECNKENTELCHPWRGDCYCKSGWGGSTCSRTCPLLTYGKNCEHKCKCKNNSECSPINGSCICTTGFEGEDCSEVCPENTYGEDCAQKYACKNGGKTLRKNEGFYCIAGIFAVMVVTVTSITAWFYHQRRVAHLKKIFQVRYNAQQVTPPDPTHFDNPLYSYQGSSRFDDGTATLLKNIQIENDLGRRNVKTERVKLVGGAGGCNDGDNDSCRGACGVYEQSATQNKDAHSEKPNVNIYYSTDEMNSKKGEHFYEDIKQKAAELEYDYLDYFPAKNECKLHYHHMANGSGSKNGSGHSKPEDQDPEVGRK